MLEKGTPGHVERCQKYHQWHAPEHAGEHAKERAFEDEIDPKMRLR